MNNELPYVSIVVPTFNEEKHIAICLESLNDINYPKNKYEVIVVDNGSEDSTIQIARNFDVKVYVKNNVKVGAVRNFGVQCSDGDVIAFLDGDCVVDKGWLLRGVNFLKENTVIGGQYLLRDRPYWVEKYWVLNPNHSSSSNDTLVGGCILIRREDFLKVGEFDEELNSGEDSELTSRIRLHGIKVVVTREFSVVHLGYPTDILSFIRRQIWHSIDYGLNPEKSFKDKIFIVTVLYAIGLITILAGFFSSFGVSLAGLLMAGGSSLTLTVKRVIRSKYKGSLKDKFLVFVIDNAYLIGRSIGILKGILMKLQFSKKVKYIR